MKFTQTLVSTACAAMLLFNYSGAAGQTSQCAERGEPYFTVDTEHNPVRECVLTQDAFYGKTIDDSVLAIPHGSSNVILCERDLGFRGPYSGDRSTPDTICYQFTNTLDVENKATALFTHDQQMFSETMKQFSSDPTKDRYWTAIPVLLEKPEDPAPEAKVCDATGWVSHPSLPTIELRTLSDCTISTRPITNAPEERFCPSRPDTNWRPVNNTPSYTYTQRRWLNCESVSRETTNPCPLPDTNWSPVRNQPGLVYTQTRRVNCERVTTSTTNPPDVCTAIPDTNWSPVRNQPGISYTQTRWLNCQRLSRTETNERDFVSDPHCHPDFAFLGDPSNSVEIDNGISQVDFFDTCHDGHANDVDDG